MRIGVTFPQSEIGADPSIIREYAQTADELGYTHLLAYDHVVGADITNRPNWRGPYTSETMFHEPFVLFGYLAGLTQHLEFVTGVIILPQRQTVLVAKQAAEIDVLSGGRFRLGVGLGWNEVEYEALGENFRNRARRSEEQIALLRQLFAERVVTFQGKYHTVNAAGLLPMPVQRPLPIWLGGGAEATLQRAARLADGWFPQLPPDDRARQMVESLRRYAEEAGRDPKEIGIEARLNFGVTPESEWESFIDAWRELGATHLAINTMNAGLESPQDHIAAIRRFAETGIPLRG